MARGQQKLQSQAKAQDKHVNEILLIITIMFYSINFRVGTI